MNWKSFKIKPFWRKDISEPIVTLGKELLIYDDWILSYVKFPTYSLSHKTQNIFLLFAYDMYDTWSCTEKYLTEDEKYYLGKYFKNHLTYAKTKVAQKQERENKEERQRIAKELGL